MSLIGFTGIDKENVSRGSPPHKTLSQVRQEELRIFSVTGQSPSMVGDHFSSPEPVAKSTQHTKKWLKINVLELKAVCVGPKTFQNSVPKLESELSLHPQMDLSKVVTPHVDFFVASLNHKVQLYLSLVPDLQAWKIDGPNINWLSFKTFPWLFFTG